LSLAVRHVKLRHCDVNEAGHRNVPAIGGVAVQMILAGKRCGHESVTIRALSGFQGDLRSPGEGVST
jgi:hypothetical protein